jgi:neutral amino acid transport system permease protein
VIDALELLIAGLSTGLVVGLAALAVTLVFGIARFANAATGDMMSAGAYGAFLGSAFTGSVLLGSVVGVAVGMAVGVLAYLLVVRPLAGRSSVTKLLASIGIAFVIRALVGLIFGHQQQTFPMPLVRPWVVSGVRLHPNDVYLGLAAFVSVAVTFLLLHATPIGRRMRAVADNPALARVCGIAPVGVMIALWSIAGALCSVAGIVLGIKAVITPEMGWEILLPAFAAAILGGLGHPGGAVLAGILLGIVQEISTPFVGFTYKLAVSFVILLLVLLARPQGLFGRVEGAR